MAKKFHEDEFDDGTQVKLSIFREYIRKWFPVFLVARPGGEAHRTVNVFDFFAGPGTDRAGNPGSPRIIQDELKNYCQTRGNMKAEGVQIALYFNDKDPELIEQLQRCLKENACPDNCCQAIYSSQPFQEALDSRLPVMLAPRSANLIIMDQFGVKEVTPDVVNTFAECRATDILFFVSSSYVRRFADEPAIQNYLDMSSDELAASEYKSIHRHICKYFRSNLPSGIEYHLAPFSIKKRSNIYGVIFGSGSPLGLQKFLEVCWDLDGVTGEANYDIDDDPARSGEKFLLPEMNVIRKQDAFQHGLEGFLQAGKVVGGKTQPVNNLDLYRYTLERGFLPRHAVAHLRVLQNKGCLEVIDPEAGEPIRKGAYYLGWDYYRKSQIQAIFRLKD
jgi:three-Cys-motif partner protein